MINNLPTHFADQAAVDAYVAQMDALLQQAIEENTTVPGGDISDSVLVQSMIDYFQRIAASGDYTEASIHRVQALINSIPDTLTDEQARYYADLIYDAVMAMEPKGEQRPGFILRFPYLPAVLPPGLPPPRLPRLAGSTTPMAAVYYKNGKVPDRLADHRRRPLLLQQTGLYADRLADNRWQVNYYFSANGVMLTGWQKYDHRLVLPRPRYREDVCGRPL